MVAAFASLAGRTNISVGADADLPRRLSFFCFFVTSLSASGGQVKDWTGGWTG